MLREKATLDLLPLNLQPAGKYLLNLATGHDVVKLCSLVVLIKSVSNSSCRG